MSNANADLPISLYASLLPHLVKIIELTQTKDAMSKPEERQALLNATKDFKTAMAGARQHANTLLGGGMGIRGQEEVIAMLEEVKKRKMEQLAGFSELKTTMDIGSP